jgi:hypothetical protein
MKNLHQLTYKEKRFIFTDGSGDSSLKFSDPIALAL